MCDQADNIEFNFEYFLKANKNNRKAAAKDALIFLGGYLVDQPDYIQDLINEIKKEL